MTQTRELPIFETFRQLLLVINDIRKKSGDQRPQNKNGLHRKAKRAGKLKCKYR